MKSFFWTVIIVFGLWCCAKEPGETPPTANPCPTADSIGSATFYNFSGATAWVAFNRAGIPSDKPQNQTQFWIEAGQKIDIDTLSLVEYAWLSKPDPVRNNGKFTPKDCEKTTIELE